MGLFSRDEQDALDDVLRIQRASAPYQQEESKPEEGPPEQLSPTPFVDIPKPPFKDFDEAYAAVERNWYMSFGDLEPMFEDLCRLTSDLDQAYKVVIFTKDRRISSKTIPELAAKRYVEIARQEGGKARSFGEIAHFLSRTLLVGDIAALQPIRLRLLRRLVPLSDNQKQAEEVLDLTREDSPEERLAMKRLLRFYGDNLHSLRKLVHNALPGTKRERMLLKHYLHALDAKLKDKDSQR